MKKIFNIQKISSKVYILIVIATFLFSLAFMTSYANLAGFEYPSNIEITEFYNSMQSFNFMIYYFAIAGLITIALLIAMEVTKKVADKTALIIVGISGSLGVIASIVSLILLPILSTMYSSETLLDNALNEQIATWSHTINFSTFYIGYVIYGLLLVVSITLVISTIISNRKFVKEMAGN